MKNLLFALLLAAPAVSFAYGPLGPNSGGVTATSNLTVEDLTVNGDTVLGSNGADTFSINVATIALSSPTVVNIGTTTTGSGTSILALDTANQRVGVNTTAPAYNFQVGSSASGATVAAIDGGAADNIGLYFLDGGTLRSSIVQNNSANGDVVVTMANGGDWTFNNSQVNSDFVINSDNQTQLVVVDASVDGVKIGAAGLVASRMLDVVDNAKFSTVVQVSSNNGTSFLAISSTGGVTVGSPTGGNQGLGTINLSSDVFKNGTAFANPDYVFEKEFTGEIVEFAENEGAGTYTGRLDLKDLKRYVEYYHSLPRVREAKGIFSRSDVLLEKLEEAYLYIFDLEKRIAALEEKR